MHIELRFYQTYDKNGVNSQETLQFRYVNGDNKDEWEDVDFMRERELYYDAQSGHWMGGCLEEL